MRFRANDYRVLRQVGGRFRVLAPSAPSVLKLPGQRLVKHEVRDGLDVSRIEPRRLIHQEVSLR